MSRSDPVLLNMDSSFQDPDLRIQTHHVSREQEESEWNLSGSQIPSGWTFWTSEVLLPVLHHLPVCFCITLLASGSLHPVRSGPFLYIFVPTAQANSGFFICKDINLLAYINKLNSDTCVLVKKRNFWLCVFISPPTQTESRRYWFWRAEPPDNQTLNLSFCCPLLGRECRTEIMSISLILGFKTFLGVSH